MRDIPLSRVKWSPAYRLVPSHFPPVGPFDDVSTDEELEEMIVVASLTNDRVRDEIGDITIVPKEERLYGPGATPVMAAFTHLNPNGSRFSDGTFGVLYAGREIETAIYETLHHRERFLLDINSPPMQIEMREYRIEVSGKFRDLRRYNAAPPYLNPDSYAQSQPLGKAVRRAGEYGLVYPSVRHEQGECVAAFTTQAVSRARQGRHYEYIWDGKRITQVRELRETSIVPRR